jgi:hypothetical protein
VIRGCPVMLFSRWCDLFLFLCFSPEKFDHWSGQCNSLCCDARYAPFATRRFLGHKSEDCRFIWWSASTWSRGVVLLALCITSLACYLVAENARLTRVFVSFSKNKQVGAYVLDFSLS